MVHLFAVYIVHLFAAYMVHLFAAYMVHLFAAYIVHLFAVYMVHLFAAYMVHLFAAYIVHTALHMLCRLVFHTIWFRISVSLLAEVRAYIQLHDGCRIGCRIVHIPRTCIVFAYCRHLLAEDSRGKALGW
jgi:hypothetical protein